MIKKNIFQSWYTRDLCFEVKAKVNLFKEMNPEYKYYLFTDQDMDNFVNKYYPGEIAECYNKLNIIVAKVDFWRYLVLYKYGGVYLDMDSSIERPLSELIREDDSAIITKEGNPYFFVQWALIFAKRHPILKRTIDLIVFNIKNNLYPNNIHEMTGPSVYTRAINDIHMMLFHKQIDYDGVSMDRTFRSNNVSYRFYGIDYNGFFTFKHEFAHLLYNEKKHWREEQMEKELLKEEEEEEEKGLFL